jgi:hypothetical protein
MQNPQPKYYQSKYDKLSGNSYRELIHKAHAIANSYNPNPKRKAYIRSKYFNGDNIFLEYFWQQISNVSFPALKRKAPQCSIETSLPDFSRYGGCCILKSVYHTRPAPVNR